MFGTRFYILPAVLAVALASVPAPATTQHGGKAEPNRISFRRGSDSASVSDRVRGDEEAEYVAAARAGQQIFITIQTQPAESLVVTVSDPENNQVTLNRKADKWNGSLSKDGDYQIVVQKRNPDRITSRYKMTVRIK